MGAFGIALLTMEALARAQAVRSSFIGFDALRTFECSGVTHDKCGGCANTCKRSIVRFNNGAVYCAGNRCEKGNMETDTAGHRAARYALQQVPSLARFRATALVADYGGAPPAAGRGQTIGIPRILEFYNSFPFWKALFSSLGFTVKLSPRSNHGLHEKGMRYVASDNICFPAKIAHGHIEYLLEQKVDRIFMPLMIAVPSTLSDKRAVHMCPVLEEYRLDKGEVDWAIAQAEQAAASFRQTVRDEGRRVLAEIEAAGAMGVILAGRPYHYDSYINHGIPEIFASLGIPLLTMDSLPDVAGLDLRKVRPDLYNPFHSEIYAAGLFAAAHPCLEVVQLVSFGCGHDAIISDELARIMLAASGKQPLVLKIDEGEALGALGIRVRSFAETVQRRRA
jgi:predicted nucleotide-binding protein (sugar kinase/HSP70/actin superfamily)